MNRTMAVIKINELIFKTAIKAIINETKQSKIKNATRAYIKDSVSLEIKESNDELKALDHPTNANLSLKTSAKKNSMNET